MSPPFLCVTVLYIVAFKGPILQVFITRLPNTKDPFQRLENLLEGEPDFLVFTFLPLRDSFCIFIIEKITYK